MRGYSWHPYGVRDAPGAVVGWFGGQGIAAAGRAPKVLDEDNR